MKRMCLASVAGVLIAAIVLLAGSPSVSANAPRQAAAPGVNDVKIDNFSFGPGTLSVAAGTTVTWTNRDDIPHTVVSTDGVFKSKVVDTDEKFSYVRQAWNLLLLLFNSPQDDREDCGAVRRR